MSIESQLSEYIQSKCLQGKEASEVNVDDNLIESGILDSLATMQLVAYCEQEFNIKIAPQEILIENFSSISAMTKFVEGKVEK